MVERVKPEQGAKLPEGTRYVAENIADFLGARDFILEEHTQLQLDASDRALQAYKNGEGTHHLQRALVLRGVDRNYTYGRVLIPRVSYSPQRDHKEAILARVRIIPDKILLFDQSGEIEPYLPDFAARMIFQYSGLRMYPREALKIQDWTSDVLLGYTIQNSKGKHKDRYSLLHVSKDDLGKPIPTEETRLRQLGFDIKR
jgi:hypothetical protein